MEIDASSPSSKSSPPRTRIAKDCRRADDNGDDVANVEEGADVDGDGTSRASGGNSEVGPEIDDDDEEGKGELMIIGERIGRAK